MTTGIGNLTPLVTRPRPGGPRSTTRRPGDLLTTEWIKLCSVRPTYLALLAAAVLTPLIATGVAQGNVSYIHRGTAFAARFGRAGRNLTEHAALQHVAGNTVINYVTVRDWQHRTREFLSGKTFENTTPVGPALVTTGEVQGMRGVDVAPIESEHRPLL